MGKQQHEILAKLSCRALMKFNFRSKMPIFGLKRLNDEILTEYATLNLTKFKPK